MLRTYLRSGFVAVRTKELDLDPLDDNSWILDFNCSMFILLVIFLLGSSSYAKEQKIVSNEVVSENAPAWLTRNRMEKVTQRIQRRLEWATRRVSMRWYFDENEFSRAHGGRTGTIAFTKQTSGVASIHMGPTVTTDNFDQIFGHELVHVIASQKYKTSIPKWLEEGLANHLSGFKKVDYKWLAKQPGVENVYDLAHPFSGDSSMIHYRYMASQALAEMLDGKCKLERLIQLSVERKIEDYIKTYCKIPNLNKAFHDWVKKRG